MLLGLCFSITKYHLRNTQVPWHAILIEVPSVSPYNTGVFQWMQYDQSAPPKMWLSNTLIMGSDSLIACIVCSVLTLYKGLFQYEYLMLRIILVSHILSYQCMNSYCRDDIFQCIRFWLWHDKFLAFTGKYWAIHVCIPSTLTCIMARQRYIICATWYLRSLWTWFGGCRRPGTDWVPHHLQSSCQTALLIIKPVSRVSQLVLIWPPLLHSWNLPTDDNAF